MIRPLTGKVDFNASKNWKVTTFILLNLNTFVTSCGLVKDQVPTRNWVFFHLKLGKSRNGFECKLDMHGFSSVLVNFRVDDHISKCDCGVGILWHFLHAMTELLFQMIWKVFGATTQSVMMHSQSVWSQVER